MVNNLLINVLVAVAMGRMCELVILASAPQVDSDVVRAEKIHVGEQKIEVTTLCVIPKIVITPPTD